MAVSEDLVDFDLIETHKENIQQLPGGRSARQLATLFSPTPALKSTVPDLDDTKTLNDAIRREYEIEVQNIGESDDPLDVYDRYVKWTLNAYPSAQATPQSQLLPLLERATKAFLSSSHYKNDPRYLKLWLHYIRWFSDAPREIFAYLARHKIGEGLALFYEEFASWLEGAGRWIQAEEVYTLGVQKEARPTERLMRKFGQFQQRFDARPEGLDEPASPALPAVRPALATKIDPFALTPRSVEQPTSRTTATAGSGPAARNGKPKLAIFSDAGEHAPPVSGTSSDGWQSIGSLQERKKENTVTAKPWAGETLKGAKRVGTAEKMTIFKDQTLGVQATKKIDRSPNVPPSVVNSKTGRPERVFVDLEAVYPNPSPGSVEMSFDELRAMHRGWADMNWHEKNKRALQAISGNALCSPEESDVNNLTRELEEKVCLREDNENSQQSTPADDHQSQGGRARSVKQKKMKIREIKQETQTIKANLASPTGPKIRRKLTAEPTMTFHSKAATNDVYDLFNQPLKCEVPKQESQSGGESDLEDDGYSTAGESTGTGIMSGATSECGKEDTSVSVRITMTGEENTTGIDVGATDVDHDWTQASLHPDVTGDENTGTDLGTATNAGLDWTEFSPSKHIPRRTSDHCHQSGKAATSVPAESAPALEMPVQQASSEEEVRTPVDPETRVIDPKTTTSFVPLTGEDYDPTPLRPYRDPANGAPSRLPFMTPIVERTESSLGANTAYQKQEWDYFSSLITPSRLTPAINESPSKVGMERLILASPSSAKSILPPRSSTDSRPATKGDATSPSPKSKRLSRGMLEEAADELTSPRKRVQTSKLEDSPVRLKVKAETTPTWSEAVDQGNGFIHPSSTPRAAAVKRRKPIIPDLQCYPTDASIREKILSHSQPAVSSLPGFFNHPNQSWGKSTQLQRYAKKVQESKVKTSPRKGNANGNEKTTTQAIPPILSFPEASRVYAVKRELGRGAFAAVYLADSYDPDQQPLDGSEEVEEAGEAKYNSNHPQQPRRGREAVKAECPPSQAVWEFHIIRTVHARLLARSFLSSSARQRTLASIITAHECHAFADEVYLVLDYAPTGTLLDLINTVKDSNQRAGKTEGGLDEGLAMFFAVELLRTMEELHRIGILHGDLKGDNCLLRLPLPSTRPCLSTGTKTSISTNGNTGNNNNNNNNNNHPAHLLTRHLTGPYSPSGANGWSNLGIKLIDFGRGIDVTAFPNRVGFIADWAAGAGATDAPEIREARPWVAQIDLWAAAGVVHSLLWGKYMDTVVQQQTAQSVGSGGGGGGDGGGVSTTGDGLLLPSTRQSRHYRLKNGFKRYWAADVWTRVFEVLLNPPPSLGPSLSSSAASKSRALAENGQGNADGDDGADAVASINPSILTELSRVRGLMEAWLETEGEKKGLKALLVKRVSEVVASGFPASTSAAGGGGC